MKIRGLYRIGITTAILVVAMTLFLVLSKKGLQRPAGEDAGPNFRISGSGAPASGLGGSREASVQGPSGGSGARQGPLKGGASEHEVAAALQKEMEQVRNRGPVIGDLVPVLTAVPDRTASLLTPYFEDSSPLVRHRAYALLATSAHSSGSNTLRRRAVELLLGALDDPAPIVAQHAERDLLSFEGDSLSSKALEELHRRLQEPTPSAAVIRLAGSAQLESEVGRLQEVYENGPSDPSLMEGVRAYATPEWAAALALARFGQQAPTVYVVDRISREQNEVIRVTSLLADAAYTRQPDAIELIRKHLDGDERLPSIISGIPGTPYAQYALDTLAGAIPGFVVGRKKPGEYTDTEIEMARRWMSDRSNWVDALGHSRQAISPQSQGDPR